MKKEVREKIIYVFFFLHSKSQLGKNEWTPLHLAAFSGNRPMVEALIASGANTEAKDSLVCF
jgi:ankyrin repeat protein